MITKKKGNVIQKDFCVLVECPECQTINYVELDGYIDRQYVDILCEECEDFFKIDMFETYSGVN